jgi:hypothetical protein
MFISSDFSMQYVREFSGTLGLLALKTFSVAKMLPLETKQ